MMIALYGHGKFYCAELCLAGAIACAGIYLGVGALFPQNRTRRGFFCLLAGLTAAEIVCGGIGWYALRLSIPKKWQGKKVFLHFGAVDESAWIYLNGKFCGERVSKDPDDWKKSFSIRIDRNINWQQKYQSLVVKVRDIGGQGGIWQPVTLGCKEKEE